MTRAVKFQEGQIPMGIRLPRGLYEELQDRAIASGVPIAEQFRRALRYWFDEHPVAGTKGGPARIKRTKFVSLKPSKSVAAKKGAKKR